jgi:hypothetical protein
MGKRPKVANFWMGLGVFGVLAILTILTLSFVGVIKAPASVGGSGIGGGSNTIITTGAVLNFKAVDAAQQGTAVSPVWRISKNGGAFGSVTSGTDTVAQGTPIEVIANASTYHTLYVPSANVPNQVSYDMTYLMVKNATVTIVVATDPSSGGSSSAMTNGGGATNQTVATSGNYNMVVYATGTAYQSTQDMRCVLEASDKTKINKLSLSSPDLAVSFAGTSIQAFYSAAATTSQVFVYDVAPISDANTKHLTLRAESVTGQSMAGAYFIVNCYTKEHFLRALDGRPAYDIQDDSTGTSTAKFGADYSFKGYFQ